MFSEGNYDSHRCPDLYLAMATEEVVAAYPASISSIANMKPDELEQYLRSPDETRPNRSELYCPRNEDPRITLTTLRPLACPAKGSRRMVTSQSGGIVGPLLAGMKQLFVSQAWRMNGRIPSVCPDDKARIQFSKLGSWINAWRYLFAKKYFRKIVL